ncbi:unnamed protein product [Sympodiomycopsis kandeliae]
MPYDLRPRLNRVSYKESTLKVLSSNDALAHGIINEQKRLGASRKKNKLRRNSTLESAATGLSEVFASKCSIQHDTEQKALDDDPTPSLEMVSTTTEGSPRDDSSSSTLPRLSVQTVTSNLLDIARKQAILRTQSQVNAKNLSKALYVSLHVLRYMSKGSQSSKGHLKGHPLSSATLVESTQRLAVEPPREDFADDLSIPTDSTAILSVQTAVKSTSPPAPPANEILSSPVGLATQSTREASVEERPKVARSPTDEVGRGASATRLASISTSPAAAELSVGQHAALPVQPSAYSSSTIKVIGRPLNPQQHTHVPSSPSTGLSFYDAAISGPAPSVLASLGPPPVFKTPSVLEHDSVQDKLWKERSIVVLHAALSRLKLIKEGYKLQLLEADNDLNIRSKKKGSSIGPAGLSSHPVSNSFEEITQRRHITCHTFQPRELKRVCNDGADGDLIHLDQLIKLKDNFELLCGISWFKDHDVKMYRRLVDGSRISKRRPRTTTSIASRVQQQSLPPKTQAMQDNGRPGSALAGAIRNGNHTTGQKSQLPGRFHPYG